MKGRFLKALGKSDVGLESKFVISVRMPLSTDITDYFRINDKMSDIKYPILERIWHLYDRHS